ncbi:MAG: hypothetical protein ACE5JN_16615 [Candidatus Methylomirabilia bacterium]
MIQAELKGHYREDATYRSVVVNVTNQSIASTKGLLHRVCRRADPAPTAAGLPLPASGAPPGA